MGSRAAVLQVRIHLPPAGSLQTFDSCVHPLPCLETRSGIGRTRGIDASNPAPSSVESDELSPEQARSPVLHDGVEFAGTETHPFICKLDRLLAERPRATSDHRGRDDR